MKQKTPHPRFGILAITAGIILVGAIFVSVYTITAFAFNGPSQSPPSGYGAIGSDASNDVSIGTSTPISGMKLTVIGASSDNTTNAAEFLQNNGTPIFILHDDGSVTATGNITANQFVGNLNASLVTSGAFPGGNYYFPASVGIGTTTPIGQLANNGTNYGDLGSGLGAGSFNWNNTGGGWNNISSAGTAGLVVATDQTTGTTFQVSSGVYNTGTGQRPNHLLTVLGSGNVGIGTAAPGTILDVTGTATTVANIKANVANNAISINSAYGTGSNYAPGISWRANDVDTTKNLAGVWAQITSAGSYLQFGTSNNYATGITNTAMSIDYSGDVGIGTTAPTTALTVVGNVSSTGICLGGTCDTSWPSSGGLTSYNVSSANGLISVSTTTTSTALTASTTPTFTGNVTAPNFIGNLNASLVTSGAFPGGNYTFPSKVGIGTTSPAFALDMAAGDAYGYNGLLLADASTSLVNYFFGGGGNLTATGNYNTGLGNRTLSALTTASGNTASGYAALADDTTGGTNEADGYAALILNTGGTANTANGYEALYNNTTGLDNTANGFGALFTSTSTSYQTATGLDALYHSTGANNEGDGYEALYNDTTGTDNTANGFEALNANTTGQYNEADGSRSLISNTTGIGNTAIGFEALYTSTSTSYQTATGYAALYHSTGLDNEGDGFEALYTNSTGAQNTANGYAALSLLTTGTYNTAEGFDALTAETTAGSNTAIGGDALMYDVTGTGNTAVGLSAGRFSSNGVLTNTDPTNSVDIGYAAYPLTATDTNEIVIGANAIGLGSNTAVIGSSTITTTELMGNVGIGTASPGYNLTVNGTSSALAYCINGANCITSWPSGGGSGTVTGITAGTGLSGGTITASGTISLNLGNPNTWTAPATFNAGVTVSGGVINLNSGGQPLSLDTTSGNVTIGNSSGNVTFDAPVTMSGNLNLGSYKITAGQFDPLYTINGTNYATYAPGITGAKEETAGTLDLQKNIDGTYSDTLSFADAAKGSDLWLFAEVTNLKNTMGQLIVDLTPSFDGNVWYTKDAASDALTIHGSAAGEVSYNLTAPTFDAAQWPNLAPASEANTTGVIVNQ